MHAACTAMVGMVHGIFNVLVQSAYRYLAFGWSAIMLLPQVVPIIHKKAPAIGPGKI